MTQVHYIVITHDVLPSVSALRTTLIYTSNKQEAIEIAKIEACLREWQEFVLVRTQEVTA